MRTGFILIITGIALTCRSQPADERFATANSLYADGLYDSAAAIYRTLLDDVSSAEVEFNLANAYSKLDKIAPAILHYERALRLNPHDADMEHNLRLANLRVTDKAESEPRDMLAIAWQRFLYLTDPTKWAWLAVAMVWVAFICGVVVLVYRRTPGVRGFFWLAIVFSALALIALGVNVARSKYGAGQREAIVFSASAYVKSEPRAESTDLFILHEGAKVRVLESYASWSKVQFGREKTGWLGHSDIEEI